jgi:hypothetical protein
MADDPDVADRYREAMGDLATRLCKVLGLPDWSSDSTREDEEIGVDDIVRKLNTCKITMLGENVDAGNCWQGGFGYGRGCKGGHRLR